MGMTIDEVIKEMKAEYSAFLEGTGLNNPTRMEKERNNNLDCDKVCTANEMTLDILRKYQKIQEIIDNWENSGEEDDPINIIDNIEEVLEDGKIG